MSKATTETMDALHGLLASTLSSEIDAARSAEDKKGFASLLNVARALLKDNGVEVSKQDRAESLGSLAKVVLPFGPKDDGPASPTRGSYKPRTSPVGPGTLKRRGNQGADG